MPAQPVQSVPTSCNISAPCNDPPDQPITCQDTTYLAEACGSDYNDSDAVQLVWSGRGLGASDNQNKYPNAAGYTGSWANIGSTPTRQCGADLIFFRGRQPDTLLGRCVNTVPDNAAQKIECCLNGRGTYCPHAYKPNVDGSGTDPSNASCDTFVEQYCSGKVPGFPLSATSKDPRCGCMVFQDQPTANDLFQGQAVFLNRPDCFSKSCTGEAVKTASNQGHGCPPFTLCSAWVKLNDVQKATFNQVTLNATCGQSATLNGTTSGGDSSGLNATPNSVLSPPSSVLNMGLPQNNLPPNIPPAQGIASSPSLSTSLTKTDWIFIGGIGFIWFLVIVVALWN